MQTARNGEGPPSSPYNVVKGMVAAMCSSQKSKDPRKEEAKTRGRALLSSCPDESKIDNSLQSLQSAAYLMIIGQCDPSVDFLREPETTGKVCGWSTYFKSDWGESAKVITAELNKFRVNGL